MSSKTIEIGDLVQFKGDYATSKTIYKQIPQIDLCQAIYSADTIFANTRETPMWMIYAQSPTSFDRVPWKETAKTGMIVMDFQEVCMTKSSVPVVRQLAMRRYAQVMLFSSNPHQAPVKVWASAKELETFSDVPYLEALKARLREMVGQKDK